MLSAKKLLSPQKKALGISLLIVYVLTDVYTYSSGMDFAMLVADNHLGTLIGEPCGNLWRYSLLSTAPFTAELDGFL